MFSPLQLVQLFCFILVLLCFCNTLGRNVEIEQLTYCDQVLADKPASSLLFISTLDGKISALDAANQGEIKWTLDLSDTPMLSSTIHRLELNNDGRWVRLIPSLNGGIYQFDGENLTTMPFNSDNLLQSTFRYSDDLVFAGGKEIHSYGISALTGDILYECNISGCTNRTDGSGQLEQNVLVVQRFQKTVHAIEPRTGLERWNFSVGQHELSIISADKLNCHGTSKSQHLDLSYHLKFTVPEGKIWAISQVDPDVILWQHQFESPIVSIWQTETSTNAEEPDNLKKVDLFTSSQWDFAAESELSPSIYLGMHEKQLYVQESQALNNMLDQSTKLITQALKFPWKPYSAINNAIDSPYEAHRRTDRQVPQLTDERQTTAISVLYGSAYVEGNGFFLFKDEDLYSKEHSQCNSTVSPGELINKVVEPNLTDYSNEDDDDTPVRVIIVSLWYWWKEVLIISITTAVLLNFWLTQRLLNATTPTTDAILPPLIVERHYESKEDDTKPRIDDATASEFTSRYLTDFEPINCLGKGGYGVVFKAKNKIDDCDYAIKRIALRNSDDSRKRVMREVKALAKLDHHNIVRYFNAWLECPPRGWQEEHDRRLIDEQKFPPSEFSMGPSALTSKGSESVCIDVPRSNPSSVDSAVEALDLENLNEDDSFIVFERSDAKESEETDSVIFLRDSDENDENHTRNSSESDDTSSISSSKHSATNLTKNRDNKSSGTSVINRSDRKRSLSLNIDAKAANTIKPKSLKMYLYIQMQLCQEMSLKDWLKNHVLPRDKHRAVQIFHQIVDAVEYVHFQGLIHRDLKPSNIFFAFDERIKIGDFGLVTAMTVGCNDEARTPDDTAETNDHESDLHTARVGTHLYMSPEQMAGQSYDYKVDIYSLGIIFYELLVPFSTEMERVYALRDLRKSIFPPDFSAKYPAEYDLLNMMLDPNPKKRPTTLGVKARPPLVKLECKPDVDRQWHFNLPSLSKNSSVTSSSSGESWENHS